MKNSIRPWSKNKPNPNFPLFCSLRNSNTNYFLRKNSKERAAINKNITEINKYLWRLVKLQPQKIDTVTWHRSLPNMLPNSLELGKKNERIQTQKKKARQASSPKSPSRGNTSSPALGFCLSRGKGE